MMTASTANLLVLFGATGDLAQRMLLPSLYGLERDGPLPPRARILATARSELSRDAFRDEVAKSIEHRVPVAERDDTTLRALLDRIDYVAASVGDAGAMSALA